MRVVNDHHVGLVYHPMDCEYCSDKTGVEMKTKQFIHLVQIGLLFLNKGQSTDNRTCGVIV